MDHNAVRPVSRGQSKPNGQVQSTITPKVFNCIVDETALIQGAKKNTRDGIRKWIADGRIRLFVPLYALGQASRLKELKGRISGDAGETLVWLDEATSEHPDLVVLQGGYDQYESWAEVENFALPKTLFSEDDDTTTTADAHEMQGQTAMLSLQGSDPEAGQSFSSNESCFSDGTAPSDRSLRSGSPLSPPTSPPKKYVSLATSRANIGDVFEGADTIDPTGSGTPLSVQPLFNYILWRVHQESDPSTALESFIFLCDNPALRKHAQRFGIRSKTLAEMRYVITRESQDARNRRIVQSRGPSSVDLARPTSSAGSAKGENARPASQQAATKPVTVATSDQISDDDEILLKRAPKAPVALMRGAGRGRGRMSNITSSPRAPAGPAYVAQDDMTRGTTAGRGRGRDAFPTMSRSGLGQAAQPDGPIDPNSFVRPSPTRGRARGGRGLWMPG